MNFLAPGKLLAGKWGTHATCDTPFITVENLFQHLASIKDQVIST